MINISEQCRKALVADARRMYVKAVMEIIDPDFSAGSVSGTTQDAYSKSAQLYDKIFEISKYATLEKGRWHCDSGYKILPDDAQDLTDEVGFMTSAMTDENGNFSVPQYVQMNFSGVETLKAMSVVFSDNADDGIPTDFTIEIYQGGTVYFSKTITGNTQNIVSFSDFTVYSPDSIKLIVSKLSLGNRRLRVVEIVPGIYERWNEDFVSEVNIKQEINPSCLTLPYGNCKLTIDNQNKRFEPRAKNGVFEMIEERQPVSLSYGVLLKDRSIEYVPAGVYYQYSGGWTQSDNKLTITWELVDIVGLLSNRAYIVPNTLPTTLNGWIADLVSQLGENFQNRYIIDDNYKNISLTASADDLKNVKCGDVLRYLCMAAGCFPRADSETGYLAVEPLWNSGTYFTLDNMNDYPQISANKDLALIEFTLADSNRTVYRVGGNATSSGETASVRNPFIHTQEAALNAARNILSIYGGNAISLNSRGDLSSECGDVSSVELDESSAISARLVQQTFSLSDGIMKNLPTKLVQGNGTLIFNVCEIITANTTWTAPSGITSLYVIVVGGGNGGQQGKNGSWDSEGENGADGEGGKVYAAQININSGQTFNITIGQGGASGQSGTDTTFGIYSSASGSRYNGYTDIRNGKVYARNGIKTALAGSGDGGMGGRGGKQGQEHTARKWDEETEHYYDVVVTDQEPTPGKPGKSGASGCVVVWYNKE